LIILLCVFATSCVDAVQTDPATALKVSAALLGVTMTSEDFAMRSARNFSRYDEPSRTEERGCHRFTRVNTDCGLHCELQRILEVLTRKDIS
jgi:hypothetical protein